MLCMEKRLDWELEGVRTGFVLYATGDDRGRGARAGVDPYGLALLKLYAGSI